MPRQLGKHQVHEPMQLPEPVAVVLHQAVAEADQLPELSRSRVWQPCHGWPLLLGETRDADGVDAVRLRPL